MIAFSYYLLKVIICSAVLFGYYWLALRNKVFHGYNRFYLLVIILLSLTLPTLHINLQQQDEVATTNTIKILQVVTATDDFIDDLTLENKTKQITLNDVLPYLYMLVSALLLLAFINMLYKIFMLYKKNEAVQLHNIYLVNTNAAKGTPFSFFRTIFWNNEIEITSTTGQSIFKHELAHIQERHSYDKIFITIVLTIFWCNPIFWLIKKELNMIHEFIADKYAVEDGNTSEFAHMLLAVAYPKHSFSITNHFFYSPIKRRLAMITKNKNPKVNYISRLLALPILLIVFAAFTLKAKTIQNKVASKNTSIINNEAKETNTNTTDKGLLSTIAEIFTGAKENTTVENKASVYSNERPLIVVIDAGHGGKDDGAIGKNGITEKDLTLALIKKIKAMHFRENIKIILTREEDIYNTPIEKAAFTAAQNADLFISVHLDAAEKKSENISSGMCIYVSTDTVANSTKSKVLASAVIGAFNNNYGLQVTPNPRQRKVGIKVINANNIPSILIEAGYISNDKDLAYLQSDKGQETFATNVLAAIETYAANNTFGEIKAQAMAVDSPPANSTTYPRVEIVEVSDEYSNSAEVQELTKTDNNISKTGLLVVNNKAYEYSELLGKTIRAKRRIIYLQVTQGQIKKYGEKAKNGLTVFDNAIIEISTSDNSNKTVTIIAEERLFVKMKVDKHSAKIFTNFNDSVPYLVDASEKNNKTIKIRGFSHGSNQDKPLYVIDGIEKNEATMKDLNPNDIKTVNVLKDKAAIDLYGEKGKNGVIQITTKKTTTIADSSTNKK